MSERPGVMFYFQDWTPLLSLTDESLARLFRATIAYAADGVWPELSGVEEIVWGLIFPKVDRDGERYQARKESGGYAAYVRERKRAGLEPLSFEDWKIDRDRRTSNDIDEIQQQTQRQSQSQKQLQLQSHSQSQEQGQVQGQVQGYQGEGRPYAPLPEPDFENQRAARQRMLDTYMKGERFEI